MINASRIPKELIKGCLPIFVILSREACEGSQHAQPVAGQESLRSFASLRMTISPYYRTVTIFLPHFAL